MVSVGKATKRTSKTTKTERFKFTPSISDGQLLFMQHLISKLDSVGMGVVVHNGSTLFSGDAGSAESNIRKWMLDSDLVEAVIQLPTDEFFNTGIYTYLWVLNKNKQPHHKNKVMLINASDKFKPLKKSKGSKRKEVDEASRLEIVETLTAYQDNDYARVFAKEFFYFNKQAILLTNVDEHGNSFSAYLPMLKDKKTGELKRATALKLVPTKITYNEQDFTQFKISFSENPTDETLAGFTSTGIQEFVTQLQEKDSALVIHTEEAQYWYDTDQESIIKQLPDAPPQALGCGSIQLKSNVKKAKKATKNAEAQEAYLEISVELTPDYQKDYEIIHSIKTQPKTNPPLPHSWRNTSANRLYIWKTLWVWRSTSIRCFTSLKPYAQSPTY